MNAWTWLKLSSCLECFNSVFPSTSEAASSHPFYTRGCITSPVRAGTPVLVGLTSLWSLVSVQGPVWGKCCPLSDSHQTQQPEWGHNKELRVGRKGAVHEKDQPWLFRELGIGSGSGMWQLFCPCFWPGRDHCFDSVSGRNQQRWRITLFGHQQFNQWCAEDLNWRTVKQ